MLSKSAIFPTIGNHEYHNSSGGDNPPTAANNYHWAFEMPLKSMNPDRLNYGGPSNDKVFKFEMINN